MLFLLFYLLLFSSLPFSLSEPPFRFHINCGGSDLIEYNGQQWVPDSQFISMGTRKTLHHPWLVPILSTVRSFPQQGNMNKKFCYDIGPVIPQVKYMVRTTYFYGGVNGNRYKNPPVFDQIVDGTMWSLVNTTADYERDISTYYEGVFMAKKKTMSICIGVNEYSDSDPFISAIELVALMSSVYNSTDFGRFGLSLVARHNFGYDGPIIRSPDDPFDRFWQPFGPHKSVEGVPNVSVSDFWNLPPAKIFDTHLTADKGPLELQWPKGHLPSSNYYIALYFADDPKSELGRKFSVSINDVTYFSNLNVKSSGVAIFATQWPLSGVTNIKLTPTSGSASGPIINGGEAFNVLLLGRKTFAGDVQALETIKQSLNNPPDDWNGDPCFPERYTWTGIRCSNGTRVRIISIVLMDIRLSGTLSPAIANLTALRNLVLRNNYMSGRIPSSIGALQRLEVLSLENNYFDGTIPSSLGAIRPLRELHLENNYLHGTIPRSLLQKPGLHFTFTPGNYLTLPSQ